MESSNLHVVTNSHEIKTIKDIASYVEPEYNTFTSILEAYLNSGKTLSHLVELMYADVDGRVSVSPVSLGTTVYVLRRGLCDKRNRDRCSTYCDGWDYSCDDYTGEIFVNPCPFVLNHLYSLGDTVFLSEEEAYKRAEEMNK